MPESGTTWRGSTALVTGGSSGVGLEIARALAADGADVVLPVRDRAKGERVADRIHADGSGRPRIVDLDLADLGSVDVLADRLLDEGTPIDLLVLNAGVVLLGERRRRVTGDGHELHFQTNFLAHARLVLRILPLLQSRGSRVAVQCSLAAATARLHWDDLEGMRRRYDAMRAYAASKLALGLFGVALDAHNRGDGIRVGLCHPGIAPGTAIAPAVRRLVPEPLLRVATTRWGNPPAQAALPALRALRVDAADGVAFFGPSGVGQIAGPAQRHPLWRSLRAPEDAERVWRYARSSAAR